MPALPGAGQTEHVDRPTGRRRLRELLAQEDRLLEVWGQRISQVTNSDDDRRE